jgi:hypothetical protein
VANKYSVEVFISDSEKECRKCGEIKAHSEFHKDSKNIYQKGLSYYCKECGKANARRTHKRRMEESGASNYKQKRRDQYYKREYGVSLKQRDELLKSQEGLCGICESTLEESGALTHLDHCHSTGIIRGLLCTNCNRGLGHFKDSEEILDKAIKYLIKHKQGDNND